MQFIFLIILILINAFFASTEIAFISLNKSKLEASKNKKDRVILNMINNPSKFLSTIQIGITLAGFLSSAFASESFAGDIANSLHTFFNIDIVILKNISIVLTTLILSYFTLVFGELVPKKIAMKYPYEVASFSVNFIRFISFITAPFVFLLTISTNLIAKLFKADKVNEDENLTEEELRIMIKKGKILNEEKFVINNIFEFNDKKVEDVMMKDFFALNCNTKIKDNLKEITRVNYSRIPVFENDKNNIIGMLYVKDLLKVSEDKLVKDIMKKVFITSKDESISNLFKEMKNNKVHIAIVKDENNVLGIITMEDLLEELFGEIYDEYDAINKR